MNNYLHNKNKLLEKLFFKHSSMGYALWCDLCFTNRINLPVMREYLSILSNNSNIFISPGEWPNNSDIRNINELVNLISKKNIKVNYYILYEPITPIEIIKLLLPTANNIFITNNAYDNPKIKFCTIGIRDCEKVFPIHKGFSHNYLLDEKRKNVNKEYLCLLCFSPETHPERKYVYNLFNKKDFITNINETHKQKQVSIHCGRVPVTINYDFLHKSVYCLSPRGCGVDTHRFWEALYLNTIPVVVKTNTVFDKIYKLFPCLLLDRWEDLNKELLISKMYELQNNLKIFKQKHHDNFMTNTNYINNMLETII